MSNPLSLSLYQRQSRLKQCTKLAQRMQFPQREPHRSYLSGQTYTRNTIVRFDNLEMWEGQLERTQPVLVIHPFIHSFINSFVHCKLISIIYVYHGRASRINRLSCRLACNVFDMNSFVLIDDQFNLVANLTTSSCAKDCCSIAAETTILSQRM